MTLVNLATESPGSLKATGIWTQSAGQLEVKLDYLAKAYEEMTFGINLQYPPASAPQAPRAVTISVSGNVGSPLRIVDTPVFGNVLGIGSTTQTSAAVQPAASQPARKRVSDQKSNSPAGKSAKKAKKSVEPKAEDETVKPTRPIGAYIFFSNLLAQG
jgi:hypothetical protein